MEEQEIGAIVLLATLVILLFTAGIVIVIVKRRHDQTKQELQMGKMEMEYQKELLHAQTEISEQVMSDLARELHDNIGQMMTFLFLQIENKRTDHPDLQQLLQPLTETVTHISEQLRLLSHTLNADFISGQELSEAITAQINQLKRLKKPLVHYVHGNSVIRLDKNQQLIVFRIFQEVINNALKHSCATDLYIELSGNDRFQLEVRDNGKGFQAGETAGSGLGNISKRAEMAGLKFSVVSDAGKGTICTLKQEPA